MYRTKQEVDRHVSNVLARIKDEKERNARGYQIAKLYYEAKQYEIARRYLAGFLSVRENLPQAHKLMGQIHQSTGQSAQAVASFKRSLELDDKQKDVVFKICEHYSKSNIDPERAKYWAEKGEKFFSNNEVIFKLKEKTVTGKGTHNFTEMEGLITAELVKRPTDVDLRVRLLKLYVSNGRVNEAFDHALETERTLAYVDSLPWYEYMVELFQVYQEETGCEGDNLFYSQKLFATYNLATLELQYKDVVDSAEALHRFDLCLQESLKIAKRSQEWLALLKEMQGQYFFLAGTLLLKRAQRNQLTWRDATCVSSSCYLVSLQFSPLDSQSEWFVRCPDNRQKLNDRLYKISYFRLSQTGHLINIMSRGDRTQWSHDLKQRHCTPQGQEKLYDTLFTLREMKTLKPKSFLMQTKAFCDFDLSLPSIEQLIEYDAVGHMLKPESLHYLVWLALQHYSWKDSTQPSYGFNIFPTLQYTTTTSLDMATPESLCQLDIEAFLYATVRCRASQLHESRLILPQDGSQPEILPAWLCNRLCSQEQAEWWEAAYKLYANIAKTNFPKLRLVLQRGLESVRLVTNHGMSVTMIVHLAKTFEERASEMKAKLDKDGASATVTSAIEMKTAHYWDKALEILRKLERNHPVRSSKERLFPDDSDKQLNSVMVKQLISDGEYFTAVMAMINQQYEVALAGFEKLERPYASYNTALIYKQLANDEVCTKTKEELTPDLRIKYEALLVKARDAFYLTLDRLRGDKNHELNKLLSRDLDDIETRLSRADTDDGILNDMSNLSVNSEDFEGSMCLTGIQTLPVMPASSPVKISYLAQSTPHAKAQPRSSTNNIIDEERPRLSMSEASMASHRIRPSPERLDAQMRALTFSQETVLKTVMDRNEELVRMNKDIMDELRETRALNKQLQDQISQLNQARLLAAPHYLSQTLPNPSAPYMMGAPLQTGGFPYSPQPGWMSQYGYQMPSPNHVGSMRYVPGRLSGRQNQVNQGDYYSGATYSFAPEDGEEDGLDREDNEEEDPYHIDGEYLGEDGIGGPPCYLQDNQLTQEWPYGNRAGVEGKSTITYQPQTRPPVPPGPQQPGMIGSNLRGQSIQYGYRLPTAPTTSMPGPGYFSSPQTHASVYPTNTPPAHPSATGTIPAKSLFTPQGSGSSQTAVTTTTPSMPPNVVAGPGMVANPTAGTTNTQPEKPQVVPDPSPAAQKAPQEASSTSAVQSPSALPEGVSLLFVGKAAISISSDKTKAPQNCSMKMYHILRNRAMIVVQAMSESREVVMNHEISSEITIQQQMFTTDTFAWTKTGSTDSITIKFSDNNESAGFKLVIDKVMEMFKKKELGGTQSATVQAKAQTKPEGPSAQSSKQPEQSPASSAAGMLSQLAAKHNEDATKTGSSPTKTDPGKKSVFGGFTFKSTPVISPPVVPGLVERQKAVPAVKAQISPAKVVSPAAGSTSKPFEGFSFSIEAKQDKTVQPAPTAPGSIYIMGQGAESPSFATLAAASSGGGSTQAFAKSPVVKSPMAGHRGFKASPGRQISEDGVEEYEPNVDFQPVIPLPDLVEVKTGEEDEDVLFCERSKMYRFDPETKQWKERGVGELKILKHTTTARMRIIMRRDQVLKLCANHYLTGEMKLGPMAASNKSWCWNAMDYADGEQVRNEQLAVRFKNPEIASQFKKVFEDCVNQIVIDEQLASSSIDEDTEVSKPEFEPQKTPESKSLAELFKPAAGSWSCNGCLIQNAGSVQKCAACGTLKPGVKAEDVKGGQPSGASGFQFGSSGFSFNQSTTQQPPGTGFSFSSSGFTFASTDSSSSKEKTAQLPAPSTGFSFGNKDTAENQKSQDNSTKPLSEMFKAKEGSWECSGCFIQNGGSVLKCPACGMLKPGTKPEDVKSDPVSSSSGFKFGSSSGSGFSFTPEKTQKQPTGFSFGNKDTTENQKSKDNSTKPLSEMFKAKEGSWECSGCFIQNGRSLLKCPACGMLKPGTKPEDVISDPVSSSGFKFGSSSGSGYSFTPEKTQKQPTGFSIGTSQSGSGFTFGTPTSSQAQADSTSSGFVFGSGAGATSSTTTSSSTGFVFGNTSTNKQTGSKPEEQSSTLKDLLRSTSPAKGPSITQGIATSEGQTVTSSTMGFASLFGSTPGKSGTTASIFGSPATAVSSTTTTLLSGSDSFTFGSPALAKFSFSGVVPSTPGSTPKSSFSVTSPKSPEIDDHGHYLNKDGEDSHIFFEPVVKLPDNVEVKTGEENEDILFEHRAKLYRFDKQEWKERGLGNVKVLRHMTTNRARILMRREQILKICCNHYITAEMDLKPKNEGKAWVWHADDFAEQEPKHEQFTIRFKTAEIADKFKAAFDKARGSLPTSPSKIVVDGAVSSTSEAGMVGAAFQNLFRESPRISSNTTSEDDGDVEFIKMDVATPEQVAKARSFLLPDNFYVYLTFPPCPGCIGCVDGDQSQLHTITQKSPRRITPKKTTPQKADSSTDSAPQINKDSSTDSAPQINKEADSTAEPVLFGSKTTVSFASLATQSDTAFAAKKEGNAPFAWSGAGSQLFGGGARVKEKGSEGGDDEVAPSQDVHFEPIVTLAEVEVKTGEEDDEIVFAHRSKLFRFDKSLKQWKERGIGEIKILKHKITGVYRILQRREQILKLSCNHLLTPDLQLKPMSTSETSWCWIAQDYTENEARMEQFAVRFKTIELAKEFRKIFEECQENLRQRAKQEPVEEEIIEATVTSSIGHITGDEGSPHYSKQLDKSELVREEVIEATNTRSTGFITGDNGNPFNSAHLDNTGQIKEEVIEPTVTTSTGFDTGDKGNLFSSGHLDNTGLVREEMIETAFTTYTGYITGDKGNPFCSSNLDNTVREEVIEAANSRLTDYVTGDIGNPYYSKHLDNTGLVREEMIETAFTTYTGYITGDKGNPFCSSNLDNTEPVREEVIEAANSRLTDYVTGDIGNPYYSKHLDNTVPYNEEIEESAITRSAAYNTGDIGSLYYSAFLDQFSGVTLAKLTTETDSTEQAGEGKGDNCDTTHQGAAQEEEYDDDDEYEDEEDEEDLLETIFEKRVTLFSYEVQAWKMLGMGDLKVQYDEDVNAHRIAMETDMKEKVCNHIIARESQIMSDAKRRICEWAAVDFSTDEPIRQFFRAQFSSVAASQEFVHFFEQGKQLAVVSEISERDMMSTFPREITRPEVVSSPTNKDDVRGSDIGDLFTSDAGVKTIGDNNFFSTDADMYAHSCLELLECYDEYIKSSAKEAFNSTWMNDICPHFEVEMGGMHQFLNMVLLVAVAIVTSPSTAGFIFRIASTFSQNPSPNQTAENLITESPPTQSAACTRSCDLQAVQSSVRLNSMIGPIEASIRQSSAEFTCTGQSDEWLQHCFGEANHQNSLLSGAHAALLGTCSPEISAALEELIQEGLQRDPQKKNSDHSSQ